MAYLKQSKNSMQSYQNIRAAFQENRTIDSRVWMELPKKPLNWQRNSQKRREMETSRSLLTHTLYITKQ